MSTQKLLKSLLLIGALWGVSAQAAPKVVASIAPLNSLVAAVMAGVASPELLIPAGASHHTFTLKPSDMGHLFDADMVIWIGRPLERFLVKPLTTLDETTARTAIAEMPVIKLLPLRPSGVWSNIDAAHEKLNHTIDPHLWLDLGNARVIVRRLAQRLAVIDAANAQRYEANAQHLMRRLAKLDTRLKRKLAPVKHVPFIVLHDAYHYLEEHYGLHSVGSITTDPEISPGALQILQIREVIRTRHIPCVFGEPQFQPALVSTVLEDTGARRGVLDPIGADVPPGPDAYFVLLNRLADSLVACLSAD